ncbi:sushi, von Willebrand factor type A, EGF and pentraxin domain-containing protein 1-like isoform X5 [Mya arenaria]|uniref:sushi, von Willebrand factor type A, EGF and pentraxin domain-containing protein 1-like isoform X5 n=1 Tax=Mya arenaria TaxID=6604 RepID=UPI0022E3ACF7|nr:sushi, von Willebrand factor type A, EGF and pentraxin domain-containing protein 1-like isoform X5 [Mya arenaria]
MEMLFVRVLTLFVMSVFLTKTEQALNCSLPDYPYASYYVNGKAFIAVRTVLHKDKVSVVCENGTSITVSSDVKTCRNGVWKPRGSFPICEPEPCRFNKESGRRFFLLENELDGEVAHEETVNVVCDRNFDQMGNAEDSNSEIQCLKGRFNKMYHCVERCAIPDILNANIKRSNGANTDKLKDGENITVTCHKGYSPQSNVEGNDASFTLICKNGTIGNRTCQLSQDRRDQQENVIPTAESSLSVEADTTSVDTTSAGTTRADTTVADTTRADDNDHARCPEIQIENGEIGYMGNREIYHMAYIKKCADGYMFGGFQVAECLPTLKWDNDLRCIKTLPKCPELMAENGEVTYIGDRERYTFAHIICNEGYSIEKDGVETVECLQSLQWENNLNCYKPCDTPNIENGILRSDIFNVKYSKAIIKSGQSVSVSCEAGYSLYDNKKDDFLEESTWPIKCELGKMTFVPSCKKGPDCSEECYNRQTGDSHCWGSAPGMCQKLNFISVVCDSSCEGRCFGKEQDECCHPECAGGCVGPGREQCLTCKNFYFEGSCHPYCPRMKMFDPSTYQVVNNPDGRYAFGSLCVKDCPPYLVKENDACVIECPAYKSANPTTSICQPCFEKCPEKPCRLNQEKGRHFLQFGNVLVKEAPHGTIVTVFCENGFDKDESNDASYSDIKCLRGQFEKMYHCFERCEIPQIENSEVSKLNNQSRSALKHGETIKITCQKGFILSNSHAYGRYDGTNNGSELTLTCTNGTLIGMESIMCLRQHQLENRRHKDKLNCTAPHSDDVQLYSLSSEKLAAGTVINHGKAIIAEMTCENGDEELEEHIEKFQPNEDGNPSQAMLRLQLTCTNGVIPDYETLSCSAVTTDPQDINPNECKILPNGTVTDSGHSFECNHGYAYADSLLYERYSCSCNREIPALVCSGKQAQCKPIDCKLNGSIEHGLTVMYKGLVISATAIEAIDHGESAVFNCESGGNGETYEPKWRIFKCDMGNWVVENGSGESWSLGNNGSFPECRSAKCECQNGGTCIRDETCKCSSFSTGQQCETPLCPDGCQNGGTCTSPNKCSCPDGFSGNRCQTALCDGGCKNDGTCTSPNNCTCQDGLSGSRCESALCDGGCQNGGTCTSPYRCSCTGGFSGSHCETVRCRTPIDKVDDVFYQNGATFTVTRESCSAGNIPSFMGQITCEIVTGQSKSTV